MGPGVFFFFNKNDFFCVGIGIAREEGGRKEERRSTSGGAQKPKPKKEEGAAWVDCCHGRGGIVSPPYLGPTHAPLHAAACPPSLSIHELSWGPTIGATDGEKELKFFEGKKRYPVRHAARSVCFFLFPSPLPLSLSLLCV